MLHIDIKIIALKKLGNLDVEVWKSVLYIHYSHLGFFFFCKYTEKILQYFCVMYMTTASLQFAYTFYFI